jgi:hypothetical protein
VIDDDKNLPVKDVNKLLEAIKEVDKSTGLFKTLRSYINRELTAIDVWNDPDLAVSHWILLITSANQPDEVAIADRLLAWREFCAKHSARMICIQSVEESDFNFCVNHFEVKEWPTLILGNGPQMQSFLRMGPQLLKHLTKNPGELERFLTAVHMRAVNGENFHKIEALLLKGNFWAGFKIVYDEIKGFFSFSIKADV